MKTVTQPLTAGLFPTLILFGLSFAFCYGLPNVTAPAAAAISLGIVGGLALGCVLGNVYLWLVQERE